MRGGLSLPAAGVLVAFALLTQARAGAPVAGPDHYLCYKAALAKGQPKFPKGVTKDLKDESGGPQTFDVKKIVAICNPANRDNSGIAHGAVHLEAFAIQRQKDGPKFVKFDRVTADVFAQRTLTLTAPFALLDVTPKALGTIPPAAFGTDPTSDPSVNRFKCYKAKLAKGSAKFLPPTPPTVADEFFIAGQQFLVKKVTKLCEPVDKDGETPGAETRPTSLVCYAVKRPRNASKFVKQPIATNDTNFAPHLLVATAPAELCMPATHPTATPTPTATPSTTPTPSITPTPSPTLTASPTTTPSRTPTPTPSPTAVKRVFVTSSTTKGGFGGITGADTICADRATNGALGGTFKAWISVTGDGPANHFAQSSAPYGLVNGTVIANNWADLIDGTLAHAINVDESGSTVSGPDVWTATDSAGNPKVTNCNDFISELASDSGVCGSTLSATGGWTDSSTPTCDTPLHLYCFEQ